MKNSSTSPVLELQEIAMGTEASTTEVLRRALVIATKLGLEDAKAWIDLELGGYGETRVPEHRVFKCEIVAQTRFGYMPVGFADAEQTAALKVVSLADPVGHLEELANATGGTAIYPFPEEMELLLMKCFDVPIRPVRKVGTQQLQAVLHAIRDGVLRWALELEEDGILGEGLRFTPDERERATAANIHIAGNFNGVLGDVSNATVQVGNYASVHEALKDAGIPRSERNELEDILDEMKTAEGDEQKGLMKRGLDWTLKHAPALGTLSDTIRDWFVG